MHNLGSVSLCQQHRRPSQVWATEFVQGLTRHPRTPPHSTSFYLGALALATYRVWVLGGRLGMRWSSLQVTLKSSSWWHSQGGDTHSRPHWLLGRASSSASCSRYPGLIFQGTPCATSSLRTVASFLSAQRLTLEEIGEQERREGGGGLRGAVTSSLESTLEKG